MLAAVALAALLIHKAQRRRAWAEKFSAAKREVVWFVRELIPELGRQPTAQRIIGGWQIGAGRVMAVEDQLTTLEASAVDDQGRDQARTVRDAVRTSRTRLEALDPAEDTPTAQNSLWSVAALLEAALASVDPPASPSRHDG